METYVDGAGSLAARGLLPADARSVHVAGSVVRGWGNATSDIDAYVVAEHLPAHLGDSRAPVVLSPNTIPVGVAYVDERRWDIEYWSQSQVEQMFDKVSWVEFDANRSAGNLLTLHEMSFLERLTYAVAVTGDQWLTEHRSALGRSAFRSILVCRALNQVEHAVEDAAGQLAIGDVDSAVLSARLAFGHAVDAVLAGQGEYNQSPKWRARCLRVTAPAALTFDEYWSVETMRDFDPAAPHDWVRRVIAHCRRMSLEVDL